MAGQNEDIPYSAPDFATPDKKDGQTDEDQPNKSVLVEAQEYLAETIEQHNTFDVIDLTESTKMNPTQQIAMNKSVVAHLRAVKSIIDDKIKELK